MAVTSRWNWPGCAGTGQPGKPAGTGQRLLERFDYELTDQLAENLKQQGVRIHFGYRLRELQRDGERVRAFGHDGPMDSVFDAVFFAAGRRGNSRGLGLEALGIGIGEHEQVQVDEWQTTGVPSVHAVGDIAGKVGLTPAVAASRRLMDRLFGAARSRRWITRTWPAWCSRIRRWARWA